MTFPDKYSVGKNAEVVDERYNDDYLRALNEFCTVEDVFGGTAVESISIGNTLTLNRFVANSPLKSWEAEDLLKHFLYAATRSERGEWEAIEIKEGDGLAKRVEEVGFGIRTTFSEDKQFLVPTALFLAYCNNRK